MAVPVLVQILQHGRESHRRCRVELLLGGRIGRASLDRGPALPTHYPQRRAGRRLHPDPRLHRHRRRIPGRRDHPRGRARRVAHRPQRQSAPRPPGPAMQQTYRPRRLFPHRGQPLRQLRSDEDRAAQVVQRPRPHAGLRRADEKGGQHVCQIQHQRPRHPARPRAQGRGKLSCRRSVQREELVHDLGKVRQRRPLLRL
jgi:hypothetical protein